MQQPPDHSCKTLFPLLARRAVMERLNMAAPPAPIIDDAMLVWKAGVFVTLRDHRGNLRGCIGTIEPRQANIVEEIQANAIASAFQDNRFTAVTAAELADLRFEISILHAPKPVCRLETLNPQTDGLIIETQDGQRGLMLPDIPRLDTVEKQIDAICRKTHIPRHLPLSYQTFKVEKIEETPDR